MQLFWFDVPFCCPLSTSRPESRPPGARPRWCSWCCTGRQTGGCRRTATWTSTWRPRRSAEILRRRQRRRLVRITQCTQQTHSRRKGLRPGRSIPPLPLADTVADHVLALPLLLHCSTAPHTVTLPPSQFSIESNTRIHCILIAQPPHRDLYPPP